MKCYTYDAVVIGSGCAGFNCADSLYAAGTTNIALVTEGMKMGTSRNTGSDKQTYYKLSLSSDCVDGVGKMAKSLFAGGAIHGELALSEAANSLQGFYKLVGLGMPFPQNKFGEFVGYQTDHDDSKRATSVGPLTSKYMTEVLEEQVLRKKIQILDRCLAFRLICADNCVQGVLCYDLEEKDFVLLCAPNVVMATGGCAYLYENKVYPASQSGMSGMAIEIGAKTANLSEWQYGLASIDFRWNVSGTYQQVIPKYVSVDEDGNEYEFLLDYYDDPIDALNNVFKKGYQWPFDSQKISGSSYIDICVHKELQKGRKVYMDFRNNPTGLDFNKLSDEAYTYLKNSDALFGTPIARLAKMNQKAIDLYKDHNIDLHTEMLRVAVCAQHQNGGLYVDTHYETTVKGLYAVGEAAGVYGVYRPGGTALNSCMVSSLRAAKHIASKDNRQIQQSQIQDAAQAYIREIQFHTDQQNALQVMKKIQKAFSAHAGFLRDLEGIRKLKETVSQELNNYAEKFGISGNTTAFEYFKLRDMLITAQSVLTAMEKWCVDIGYRGGAFSQTEKITNADATAILCTQSNTAFWECVKPIPESETWFEKVYNEVNV